MGAGQVIADEVTAAVLGFACAAWLVIAALLALDLLGRLPFTRRRRSRAYRLPVTGALAILTVVVLMEIATLAHWPVAVRLALGVMAVLAGLANFVCLLIALWIQSRAGQAQHAAGSGPGSGGEPPGAPGLPGLPLG